MPLFYQQNINPTTRAGIWKITEEEVFFGVGTPLREGITHPHKRLQHLAGRYLLPYLFPDFPNQEIEIADTRKPFLPGEKYHFSISHCGDYAAAIVSSDLRVGIDIEIFTPRVTKIQHKFLHPDELLLVKQYPQEQQIPLLTLLWSVKEAMFKWWGRGEVDFSEVLRIEPFVMAKEGNIAASFQKQGFRQDMQLAYTFFEQMTLVWVVTDP